MCHNLTTTTKLVTRSTSMFITVFINENKSQFNVIKGHNYVASGAVRIKKSGTNLHTPMTTILM